MTHEEWIWFEPARRRRKFISAALFVASAIALAAFLGSGCWMAADFLAWRSQSREERILDLQAQRGAAAEAAHYFAELGPEWELEAARRYQDVAFFDRQLALEKQAQFDDWAAGPAGLAARKGQ